MKKSGKIIISCLFISCVLLSFFTVIGSTHCLLNIDPGFGKAPVIDGIIDTSIDEWSEANKTSNLDFLNTSSNPSELWALQSSSNLYIAISFNLESHKETEFVGLMISNSTSNNTINYKDAKIVQFVNISNGEYEYKDYNVNDNIFTIDSQQDGSEGAAGLKGKNVFYEFKIPLRISNELEDVVLEYSSAYSFKIIYGESNSYPNSIKNSTTIIINILQPPTTETDYLELSLFILSIVIFSVTGVIIIIYTFKVITIKKQIRRIVR
ncbi:MAG: hypothetical protein JW891_04455 [Candidatus Lokiarchaeota archaeon]|nr:hypothetical protein [Candidatus Lokiarchaeota archaeon]